MVNDYRRKGDSWFLSNVCFNWLLICLTRDYDWFILFYFDSFELLEDDSDKINRIVSKFKLLQVTSLKRDSQHTRRFRSCPLL